MNTEQILEQRGGTHGDFDENSRIAQAIKDVYRTSPNWKDLPAWYKEALDMEAHKNGRILAGDPYFNDHIDDKIGYNTLVAKRLDKELSAPAAWIIEGEYDSNGKVQ